MSVQGLGSKTRRRCVAGLPALLGLLLIASLSFAETILLDEHFASLERWQPLHFPKIARHSTYTVDRCETGPCLLMESNNSASGLVLKQTFNVYEHSQLAWRWKVSNVYRKGDSGSKKGDDYPARLYVMFAYEPDQASLAKKLKYQLAKTVYGQYPPDSTISYIWDNRVTDKPFIVSAYADEARMIPVSAGGNMVNTWREYTVDIVRDYRLAFGRNPPPMASLAVMNESDNTRESARAWIQFIRLSSRP